MTTAPSNDDQNDARQKPCAAVPPTRLSCLRPAWPPRGCGWLDRAGRPSSPARAHVARSGRRPGGCLAGKTSHLFGTWAILTSGAIVGLLFTASAIPTLNVLGRGRGVGGNRPGQSQSDGSRGGWRPALGATVLACFRFAFCLDSSGLASLPTVSDGCWASGRLVGGRRLEVGATFGGIDFWFLTFAIYTAWIACTVPPRRSRALWAAAVIVVGHLVI